MVQKLAYQKGAIANERDVGIREPHGNNGADHKRQVADCVVELGDKRRHLIVGCVNSGSTL
jgi:hypothetical protein